MDQRGVWGVMSGESLPTPAPNHSSEVFESRGLAKGPTNEAIWDMEDEELLRAAKQHRKTLRRRPSAVV